MNRHTPGPWKMIKPGHGHDTKYRCVQIGKDEMYTTLEMLPADARLIAAAPELLEALKRMVDVCKTSTAHFKAWSGNEARGIEAMESAIAKAEGK